MCKRRMSNWWNVLAFPAIFFMLVCPVSARDYFVDASSGDDSFDGLTAGTAWRNLTKFSSITFQAGDKVYLKRGERWQPQTLRVFGNGSPGNEIVVDAYGDPDLPLPVIDGSSYLAGWQPYRAPAEDLPSSDLNALRFQSGWESGGEITDNGAWNGPFGADNVLSLSSSSGAGQDDRFGVISGALSLRITKNGTASAYVESGVIDTGASGEFFLRFTFRHVGRQASDNDYDNGNGFSILQLTDQSNTTIAEIGFQRGAGHHVYFRCKYFNVTNNRLEWGPEVGSWAEPTFDGRPHIVELHYVPGGDSELRFDGRFSSNPDHHLNKFVSGCAAQASKIRLGLMDGAGTRAKILPSGQDVFWIDDVAIGPASYGGWLKSPSRIYATQSPLLDAPSSGTRRYGQIWDVATGESLNNGDGKKTGDWANMGLNKMDESYLLANEFEISEAGQVFVATRGGFSPTDSSHLMPVRRYGVNISGSHIVIRNLRVEYQWENGILANKLSHHVAIEDSEMRRAVRMGMRILRPTNDIVVSNNKVWEIGGLYVSDGAGFCIHAGSGYQFGGDMTPIERIRMTDNVVWGCGAWTDNNCCELVPAQGYGIEVDTATVNVDIQRNIVLQPLGSRSWWEVYRHATNGIHLEQFDHPDQTDIGEDIVIRNNLILDYPAGIVLNKFNTAVNVDNNTIVLPKSGYRAPYAIQMSSHDPDRTSGLFGNTLKVAMRNNLFYSRPDNVTDLRSIYHPAKTDAETLTIWGTSKFSGSHNLAYHPTSSIAATLFDTRYVSYPQDWPYWVGIAGETASVYPNVDPLLSESAYYGLREGSPALNSGIDVGASYSGAAPDIGYQEGETIEIADSDMETSSTGAWSTLSVAIAKSMSTVRRGTRSLRVEGLQGGAGNRAAAAPLTVRSGEQYRVSAWVYATESVYSSGISGIAVRDLTKNTYAVSPFDAGSFVAMPNKWTYLERTFTVPQGTASISVWLMNRSLGKPAYFDDIQLTRLVPAPPEADLTISISDSPDPQLLGQAVNYTVSVTNNGPASANNVMVNGTLPGCDLGMIASGANASCVRTVTATAVGVLNQSMSATAAEFDPNNSNNSATVSTTIIAPDLTPTAMGATKASQGRVLVSDTVQNQGDGTAGFFSVAYYLSTNTTYESGVDIPLASSSGGSGTCTRSVTSLVSGATDSVSNKVCYKPTGAVKGTWYHVLVADDSGNQVTESNEINNVRASGAQLRW